MTGTTVIPEKKAGSHDFFRTSLQFFNQKVETLVWLDIELVQRAGNGDSPYEYKNHSFSKCNLLSFCHILYEIIPHFCLCSCVFIYP